MTEAPWMYLPTLPEFTAWLRLQLDAGQSRAALGRSLGVSHEAVRQWLAGGRVSLPVLILASLRMRERGETWPLAAPDAGSR
jgi:hypothetical protein